MQTKTKIIAPIVLVLMLGVFTGCSSLPPPSPEILATADYGPPPPADHQQKIRALMEPQLKDPYSAQWRFGEPWKAWSAGRDAYAFGWRVQFWINAKNEFNGYTGETEYSARFKDGEVSEIWAEPVGYSKLVKVLYRRPSEKGEVN